MAQIITICAMPIVTRLYTPEQIGVISLFLAFFAFWAATLSLRYEYALMIAEDDSEAHVVHRLAILLVGAMSVLGLPVLWALHRAQILGFGLLPYWTPFVAGPILLGYGLFMVYRSWALRAGIVKQITKASIARSAANAITRVILGYFGGGVFGLFAAEFAGAWGAMLELARNVRAHFLTSRPSSFPISALLLVGRRYIKFATLETPSTWVNQLTLTLPIPMIASLFGASAAGLFGLARAIGSIPTSQVGRAIGDVFAMELAAAVRIGDRMRARSLFYKALRRLAGFGFAPTAALGAFSPALAPLIFGSAWSEVGWIVAAIAPWLYIELVVSPITAVLFVLQAQEYKLIYDVLSLVTIAAAYAMAKVLGWGIIHLILAITVARVISYLVHMGVIILIVERRLGSRCDAPC